MHGIGRIPGEGRFLALIGVVLAALMLALSPASASELSAPTLAVTAMDGEVELAWTESETATQYRWRMSLDGGATWQQQLTGVWVPMSSSTKWGTNKQVLTNLTNGTAYTFQVRAVKEWVDRFGISTIVYSEPSNKVTATPTE